MALTIKLSKSSSLVSMNELQYIIIKPRNTINLNLFEGERYESAILIQQLIGTLVYYSNFGRYEPRLAHSWRKTNESTWVFQIRENLKAENGEVIDAQSIKKSIERSLFIFEKQGGVPILSNLIGFRKFINDSKGLTIDHLPNLKGLNVDKNKLIFNFDKPVASGLLQILSFSPFGYISKDNFNKDGSWRDNEKFISSGPYKVESVKLGHSYVLVKNEFWTDFEDGVPTKVIISHDDKIDFSRKNIIIDAFTNEYSQKELTKYKLVPEYINSILIGNYQNGFFKHKYNRQMFKKKFNENVLKMLPQDFGVNSRSLSFYPNQNSTGIFNTSESVKLGENPKTQGIFIIEGDIPIEGTSRWYAWTVLKKTLDDLQWNYKFNKNSSNFTDMTNRNYDFRIRGSSIGGGVEAWGLFVAFCSSMGINFPDPNGRVCKLLNEFENNMITEDQMASMFFEAVEDEAAILPVSHYGVSLFLSETIDTSSLSPLLAIVKFDKVVINK